MPSGYPDEFRDFWFQRRHPATYSVKVEKEAYLPRTIDNIDVRNDINVADIELHCLS